MVVLVVACALVYLVAVVRAREPVSAVIALVGLVLFVLSVAGMVQLPAWLR